MNLIRAAARPMLASMFVVGGIDALKDPQGKVPDVEPVTEPLADQVPALADLDTATMIRANGAAQVAGGLLLAMGKMPRLASTVLAATLVPTTMALMVSIFAPHFFNWTEQLRDSGHEVYWLDVFDSNSYVEQIDFVHQIIGWRYRSDFPGRYLLKEKAPGLTKFINRFNERKLSSVFEKKLEEIEPDVVHSFIMFSGVLPFLEVMKKHPEVRWIYSSWGSDLYVQEQLMPDPKFIEKILPRIDFLFTDCKRDYNIAKKFGFSGKFLGVFPGGGGIDFKKWDQYMTPWDHRKLILIKGYQNDFGDCISVLRALFPLKEQLKTYSITVFGSDKKVFEYVQHNGLSQWNNFFCLGKIPHQQVMELFGKASIYIGNSYSDGMPNTLLEAICMGVFPIQSNPGGATEELIIHGKNGFLIENPGNSDEIGEHVKRAIGEHPIYAGLEWNLKNIKPKMERELIRSEIIDAYNFIKEEVRAQKRQNRNSC